MSRPVSAPQRPLEVHDAVVCSRLPSWGIGAITDYFEIAGLFRVEFEVDGRVWSDDFHPSELRRAPTQVTRTA